MRHVERKMTLFRTLQSSSLESQQAAGQQEEALVVWLATTSTSNTTPWANAPRFTQFARQASKNPNIQMTVSK
jgi:hypothetical protein